MKSCVLIAVAVLAVACAKTPTAPTSWSNDRLREQMVLSNLNNAVLGASGRVTRWRSPIEVNTNGIERAETALQHFEQWTSGLVRFTRVAGTPASGLVFVEGGAGGPEATSACGSVVSDPPPPNPEANIVFRWDATRAIIGSYIIHLGASQCTDADAAPYPSSVAEHQLAHALGVIDHFDGFQDRGGIDDPRLLGVVYNLYANPLGATQSELSIWSVR